MSKKKTPKKIALIFKTEKSLKIRIFWSLRRLFIDYSEKNYAFHQMHTYVVSCLARTKILEWSQIIVKLILMKVNWKCVICAHSRRSKTKHSFTTLRWNTKRKRDLTVLAVIVNSTLNIRWKDISKVRFKLDQNLTLFGTGFEMKEKNVQYNSAT